MSVAILVSGHDRYSFAWDGFAHGFKKYWPDCPWPIYFITNKLEAPIGMTLKVGDDNGYWGTAMSRALGLINAEVILFMCEDYWLTAPTNTQDIISLSRLFQYRYSLNYIKLNPSIDAQIQATKNTFQFSEDALYRTSMQIAFWRKEVLQNLIKFDDSIHAFETEGGRRASLTDDFRAVKEFKYIHYIHPDDPTFEPRWGNGAVENGEFTESAYEYARREGITI